MGSIITLYSTKEGKMEEVKFRYRNKEGKIQVQKLMNNKWISRTLPTPEVTFNWLCPPEVSENSPVLEEKTPQRFGQYLLNAPSKEDTKVKFADKLFEELGLDKPPAKKVTDDEIKELEDL